MFEVCHSSYHSGHVEHSYFSTEDKAIKRAIDMIQSHIEILVDLTNTDDVAFATKINDLINNGEWEEAIQAFNQEEYSFANDDGEFHYFRVHNCDVDYDEVKTWTSSKVNKFTGAFPKSFFNAKNDADQSTEEVDNTLVFKATTPGANCRKCNAHNEWVYADKPDGTYHCHSCKLMADVFGGNDE